MPKSDGMVERFNRTLVDIVAIMLEPTKNQDDWDLQIDFATLAYRCSPQESTGETPNMMMLGREVALPLDLMTEPPEDEDEMNDYAEDLRDRMRIAHDRARKKLQVEGVRRKRNYDGRAHGSDLKEGEFVWLHNPAKKVGLSPKLMCRWEGPYLIIKRLSSVVFRIQRGPRVKPKVIHYDRLKPYTGEELRTWTTTEPATAPIEIEETVPVEPVQAEEEIVPVLEIPAPEEIAEELNPVMDLPDEGRRNPRRKRQKPRRYQDE